MQKNVFLLALLVLATGAAWAQQELAPTTDDGPLNIKSDAPQPNQDGVYQIGPGVTPPILVRPVPAAYPPDAVETDPKHLVVLSAIIGVDGVAKNIFVVHPHSGAFDQSALDAVKQSQFQPGSLNGNPVPVAIRLKVPFFRFKPAIPLIEHDLRNGGWQSFGKDASPTQDDPLKLRPGDTPPKATQTANAEFSDEARRAKYQGIVIVSLVVNEEGLPTDLHIVKPLGYGLDEKALKAVRKYRFQPAMRDGKPVAVRIMVEINFRLY
jgi:TonB family protein